MRAARRSIANIGRSREEAVEDDPVMKPNWLSRPGFEPANEGANRLPCSTISNSNGNGNSSSSNRLSTSMERRAKLSSIQSSRVDSRVGPACITAFCSLSLSGSLYRDTCVNIYIYIHIACGIDRGDFSRESEKGNSMLDSTRDTQITGRRVSVDSRLLARARAM